MEYIVKIASADVTETTICNEKQLKKLVNGINQDEYTIVEVKAIEGSYTKDYKEFLDKNENLNTGDTKPC